MTALRELVGTWLRHAKEAESGIREDERKDALIAATGFSARAAGYRRCADDLHATVAQLDCRTCKWIEPNSGTKHVRVCNLPVNQSTVRMGRVPFEVNGQPFFCAAHSPHPTDTETT